MTSSILTMILIGLVCLVAGFLAGMAFSGRGATPAKVETDKSLPAKEQPEPAVVEEVRQALVPEPASSPPASVSIVTP